LDIFGGDLCVISPLDKIKTSAV